MKMIQAIIRRERLANVKQALDAIHCPGMMVWEIMGHGKQQGMTENMRGGKFKVDLMPKMKIEIIAEDTDVPQIVEVILDSAFTNQIGDGKVFISQIEEAIRIRTREKGGSAVK